VLASFGRAINASFMAMIQASARNPDRNRAGPRAIRYETRVPLAFTSVCWAAECGRRSTGQPQAATEATLYPR
jgi:hypothetical protein